MLFMRYFGQILLFFMCLLPIFGQNYNRGAILDNIRYEQTNIKPVLLSRNYVVMPQMVSLKQFGPIAESQGAYGTCVGWATAFAARTISESTTLNRTNRVLNSNNAFSPIYVYKNISNDPTGQDGTYINDALDLMKTKGIVKRLPDEKYMDFDNILLSMFNNAKRYPISSYVRLFENSQGTPGTINERVIPVKKSLSEGKPVIIGMNTPDSFDNATDLWLPSESPYIGYGGHAMCVVGYDDNKYGGAFEILNSWGADWGNDGFIWISYHDFAAFVYHAYEIIENLAIYKEATRISASISIEVYEDVRGMPVSFNQQGFYQTRFSYPSGTDFRFLMTNKYPAYVYSFSADNSTLATQRIFPLRGVSPVIDYLDSTVAWPGEYDWIRLDETIGTDYLVVLYSKEELDISAIEKRFSSERGSFPQRVEMAVGANFVPFNMIQYYSTTIEFSATSNNPKAVFCLLLAIDHRAR